MTWTVWRKFWISSNRNRLVPFARLISTPLKMIGMISLFECFRVLCLCCKLWVELHEIHRVALSNHKRNETSVVYLPVRFFFSSCDYETCLGVLLSFQWFYFRYFFSAFCMLVQFCSLLSLHTSMQCHTAILMHVVFSSTICSQNSLNKHKWCWKCACPIRKKNI